MTRWGAFGLHLAISALVAGGLLALLYFAWYPGALFMASGMATLALLIIGVDVVIGPTLTLLVFKPGKPSLKFDLAVIVLLQVAALAYGIHVAIDSRPVWLVATPERFRLVSANELHFDPPPEAAYARAGWRGARLVGVRPPQDPQQRQALLFDTLDGRPDIDFRPGLYRPYAELAAASHASAYPLPRLLDQHPEQREALLAWLRRRGADPDDDIRYQPLIARERTIVMLLAPGGHPIGPYPLPFR